MLKNEEGVLRRLEKLRRRIASLKAVLRQLVGEMLHPLPDSRPEAGDILALAWLEEAVVARPRRQRGDTVTLLDIREEELLDN